MKVLEAQLASATILHVYGDFGLDAPGKLASMPDIRRVYLVPQVREGRRCLVLQPVKPVTAKQARKTVRLLEAIGDRLWRERLEVKLVRAVERRDAGEPAKTISDWIKLR